MKIFFIVIPFLVALIINTIFFLLSTKNNSNNSSFSSFECGFSSYFFSHNSFSNHYYVVALIFLFLDVELCILLLFFNDSFSTVMAQNFLVLFVCILLASLLYEWAMGKLEWVFWA